MRPIVKSTLTFMAKEGRFKIRHSNIERQFDSGSAYAPIGIFWGSGSKPAAAALRENFAKIAECVKGGGPKEENW
ncbi:MAG TPA: hypothetical protein VFX02_03740 [Gammaproteobacteria bacterium]|nr:hypothetical protein [Gammaproteobacteria bacterium]